jgi:hypothetical protein
MEEPTPRKSRLAIAGSFAALMLIGGGFFLLGRQTAPTPPPAAPEPAPPVQPAPPPPPTVRLLGRADLIALGNAAADSMASGTALPELVEAAAGKRFEIGLPFGCDGPAAEGSDAPMRWRYDSDSPTLRVHVMPTVWPVSDWWETPPAGVEALEGFWIARPWSSSESCVAAGESAMPRGIAPVTLPGQTLGLAQPATDETPRQQGRGDRPYEAVVRLAPDAVRLDAGLRLRLRGRIVRFPADAAVRCRQPGGSEQRPVCLVAVSLDEVAIENPATRETLATWSPTATGPAEIGR